MLSRAGIWTRDLFITTRPMIFLVKTIKQKGFKLWSLKEIEPNISWPNITIYDFKEYILWGVMIALPFDQVSSYQMTFIQML